MASLLGGRVILEFARKIEQLLGNQAVLRLPRQATASLCVIS
jgi:hypothetical protein